MTDRRLTWGICVVVAIVVLILARPFGPIGLLIGLAVALGAGLVAVTAPKPAAPRPAEVPEPAANSLTVRDRWKHSVAHHNEVLGAYGSFELDPAMLLQYPALWDLAAPEVIAFHDALELAGELRTDQFPSAAHAAKYTARVNDLRSAWATADRFARSTGTSKLSDDDARDCRRALKLLRHADGAQSAERTAYLKQVLTTVDRLAERGVVPGAARVRSELETKIRRAIEA